MDNVFNAILQDKLRCILPTKQRKRQERSDFNCSSDDDSEVFEENQEKETDTTVILKRNKLMIKKTVTDIELLRNEGFPSCCKKNCNDHFD